MREFLLKYRAGLLGIVALLCMAAAVTVQWPHQQTSATPADGMTASVENAASNGMVAFKLSTLKNYVLPPATQEVARVVDLSTNASWLTSKPSAAELQGSTNASFLTKQGNTFNGASQLVQLDGSTRLPAVDGSQLTGITGSGGGGTNSGPITLSYVADGYSTNVSVDCTTPLGCVTNLALSFVLTLSTNALIANPVNVPVGFQRGSIEFVMDATGNRLVFWGNKWIVSRELGSTTSALGINTTASKHTWISWWYCSSLDQFVINGIFSQP